MKKILIPLIFVTLILFSLTNQLKAQAPDGVNYQAVVRNNLGLPLNTQAVSVRFTIHQGSPTGTSVFQELHATTTNQFGLINLELGSVNNGAFSVINWGTGGAYYLQIEVDAGGGFDDLGASQLLSVPFALFARSAATGMQGFNSLIDTVSAGAACATGGYQVLIGLDANANTVLDAGEVTSSFYVCNGSVGIVSSSDTSATNEIQTLSINTSNDTIFLSNGGGFVELPTLGGSLWNTNGSGIDYTAGNVGIGTTTPTSSLTINSVAGNDIEFTGGFNADIISSSELRSTAFSNNTIAGGQVILETANIDRLTVLNNGNIGIGTATPFFALDVVSTDTVIAAFRGNNPDFSAVSISNANPAGATGVLLLTATDTAILGIDPAQKMVVLDNSITGGHIALNADSNVTFYGTNVASSASNMIYNQTSKIYNETDTIYNYSLGGTIINVNQGSFYTDSLYVFGNNFVNPNWVLANDGFGQAIWTDPTTLPSGGGSPWQSNVPDIYFNTGNVGIGTTTPIGKLEVAGGSIILRDQTDVVDAIELAAGTGAGASGSIALKNSGITTVSLSGIGTSWLNAGNVGIGTSTPTQLFTLSTPGSTTLRLERTNAAAFDWEMNADNLGFHLKGGADGTGPALTNFVNVDGFGKVGLGITAPTQLLHLFNGTLRIDDGVNPYNLPSSDGAIPGQVMTTDAAGNITWQVPPAPGSPISIIDADGDTEIIVEAAPDQDVIHFSLGASTGYPGAEYFTMIGPRLETINNGFSVFVGEGAGANDDLSNRFSTFIGYQAGTSNIAGASNTALGYQALQSNTTGGNNVAIGAQAFNTNISGSSNVVIGFNAFRDNNGGNTNVVIGREAGLLNTAGSGNVLIGYQAGRTEAGSNRLYIDNSSTATPLIWGNFLTNALQVNGTLNINGAYTLPIVDGASSGDVLTTDAVGNVTWQTPAAVSPWTDGGADIYPTTLTDNVSIGVITATNSRLQVDNSSQLNTAIFNNTFVSASATSGLRINNNSPGSGDKYGLDSRVTVAGSTTNAGVYSIVNGASADNSSYYGLATAAGISNATGIYVSALGNGSGNTVAVFGDNSSTTTGNAYGAYFSNSNNGSNTVYGTYSEINSPTGLNQYGVSSFNISPTANSFKYGYHAIVGGMGNTNYGIYVEANGAVTNWAAYFANGDVYIQDNLVIPFAAAAGKVLTSDAVGVASWQIPSGVGAWTSNGTETYLNSINDNVGIGTITPTSKLHIVDNVGLTPEVLLETTAGNFNIGYRYRTALSEWFMGQGMATGQQFRIADVTTGTVPVVIEQGSGNVGIGSTSPTAKLHLDGTLRLNNLSGTAPAIGAILTSMDAAGNAEWQPVPASANAWSINGNTGTVDGTNFIGTTDNVPLNFKVNGQQAGRIDASLSNAFYGYLAGRDNTTGNSNTAVGTNALVLNTTGLQSVAIGASALSSNTIGDQNVAVGHNTLLFNTTGSSNTAIGRQASVNNTTGQSNVAIGSDALFTNSIGQQNVAVGSNALQFTTGDFNTAVGRTSLYFNTTGIQNTAIGLDALRTNTTGSNNTAIGYQADVSSAGLTNATAIGANAVVGASNAMVLGKNVKVGIGMSIPNYLFHIQDSTASAGTVLYRVEDNIGVQILNIDNDRNVDIYGNLLINDGTQGAGKILTSDATGNASWQAPKASTNFSVNTSTTFIPTATMTGLIFNNVEYDNGGNFNVATGQFVASEAGVYHVDATVTFDASSNYEIQLQILRNGGTYKTVVVYADLANSFITAHISVDVFLPVANSVSVGIYQTSAGGIFPTGSTPVSKVYFTGHLVK